MSTSQLLPGSRVEHALFVKHLPAGTTADQFLLALSVFGPFGSGGGGRIFDVGRVVPGGVIPWDSVRVVLWTQSAAIALYEFISAGGLVLAGRTAQVSVDTTTTTYSVPGVIATHPEDASRVLVIRGPSRIVDVHNLDAFFRSRINIDNYTIPEMRVVWEGEEGGERERQVVATFNSWFGQARWAAEGLCQVFHAEMAEGKLVVWYGADPVEFGIVRAGQINNVIHVRRSQ